MTGVLAELARAQRPLRIVVFRALNLGDMLCFIPALRALRQAFPRAEITLVGLPAAQPVLQRFPMYVDELVLFPGDGAFPEQDVDHASLPAFYADMRARQFDVALQMHGSGGRSNIITESLGARTWAGFVPDGAQEQAGRLMEWPDHLPEITRYLALLAYLGLAVGADAHTMKMELPVDVTDCEQARGLLSEHDLDASRLIIIHAGARLLSRRWPLERYAELARVLFDESWHVALTGSAQEHEHIAALRHYSGRPLVNLCAMTSLGAMAALLGQSRLLICNDTGVSHIAAAVGAPSVVIACGSDVARWAPPDAQRNTVLHAPMACRPCAWYECPYDDHPCANAITPERVLAAARPWLMSQPEVQTA